MTMPVDTGKESNVSSEHRGEWQEVSCCGECGWTTEKAHKFMAPFFVPVCPGCGADNLGWGLTGTDSRLFESRTARPVRVGMLRRFVRWEFRDTDPA
jgi:NAD-dependent SIR2 family protein deacetylase